MKKFQVMVIFYLFFVSYPVCQASILGSAGEYNAFSLNNMNIYTSDSQGRIAAGGDINITSYGIGSKATNPADYSIVSGGNVNFSSGSVVNGGIYAASDVTISSYYVDGNITTANGNISATSGSLGATHTLNENTGQASPVNFIETAAYLNSVAYDLSQMDANGTTFVTPWHAITLSGDDDINIFNLSGDDLSNAVSLTFNIGIDDIAIVNVSGDVNKFGGFGIFGWEGKQDNILFNFWETDQLTIKNIGVKGSILAPGADVNFNSAHIDGTLIAGYITGSGEYHNYQFGHDIAVNSVPEPATASMLILGAGLAGISGMIRKRKKSGKRLAKPLFTLQSNI